MDFSETKHLPKVDHTPADLDDASRLLLKAAALIDERGLAKWMREEADGPLCFYGALSIAAFGHSSHSFEYLGEDPDCVAHARMQHAIGEWDVSQWNNRTERTKDQVVAKLRAVALGYDPL